MTSPAAQLPPVAQWALWYAKQLVKVFPLHTVDDGACSCGKRAGKGDGECSDAGKHPRDQKGRGFRDATSNTERVFGWWTRWPDSNVGIATGRASNLVVLDVDPRHGGDTALEQLQVKHGRLPPTVVAHTGGGGRHFYFRTPDTPVPSSIGKLASGLDVRGEGGYVVAPPSIHLSGAPYVWPKDASPRTQKVAPMPEWLIALLAEQHTKPGQPRPRKSRTYWRDLVRRGVPDGERDVKMTELVGNLLARGVDVEVATELVLCVNAQRCKPPLSTEQVVKIVNSIAGREARKQARSA